MSIAERVAKRFVAAVALDPKMQALLLKLRKGADASLSLPQLIKVLDLLGGWRVEKFVGLVQIHGYGGKEDKDKKALLAENSEEGARMAYARLESHVVTSLPTSPKAGEDYVMDLEPFKSWEVSVTKQKYHGTQYRLWKGAEGYKFTDPHGKVFEMLPGKYDIEKTTDPKALLKHLPMYHLMPWIKKETSYLAQINEALGMEEHVPAAQRTRENTGTCAVCFRNIKLVQRGEKTIMALHGYNRPGDGYIVGQCWGGDHSPYELSCEATERILKAAQTRIEDAEVYLKTLDDPNLAEFDTARWTFGAPPKMIRRDDPAPRSPWEHSLAAQRNRAEDDLHKAKREHALYKWLVDNWQVRELPKEGSKEIDWWALAARSSRG